ncbi:hypothetical protein [Alkalihalophilus marmarensis]|uniref:Uncharacterized protein n=1 Tax=Alkalihalophilus marmarensis DSM 21297 TaxID=1188261 RepID=U6SMI8_9BACI|nr:hypothetical protein [Alkalihalophilus marmarensis]ERN51826.1 hypothetical protein A33I_18620 [Alkalihalophilus marmarensis DSM 21297]
MNIKSKILFILLLFLVNGFIWINIYSKSNAFLSAPAISEVIEEELDRELSKNELKDNEVEEDVLIETKQVEPEKETKIVVEEVNIEEDQSNNVKNEKYDDTEVSAQHDNIVSEQSNTHSFKVAYLAGDLFFQYNEADLHLYMDVSQVEERLGTPLKEEVGEYQSVVNDLVINVIAYHYDDLIIFFASQTADVIAMVYSGDVKILKEDWWRGIRGDNPTLENDLIYSLSRKQILWINTHHSDVTGDFTIELFSNNY